MRILPEATEHLSFRRFELVDTEDYRRVVNDPYIRRYTGSCHRLGHERAEASLKEVVSGSAPMQLVAVCLRATGEVIGYAGANQYEDGSEVVIGLVSSRQGKGYGKETLRSVAQWAQANGRSGKVYARVAPDNSKSKGLITGCGWRRIDRVQEDEELYIAPSS